MVFTKLRKRVNELELKVAELQDSLKDANKAIIENTRDIALLKEALELKNDDNGQISSKEQMTEWLKSQR